MDKRLGGFSRRRGFTLLEVIFAVILLAAGLSVIYRSILINLMMIDASTQRQNVAYVFALGELKYPLRDITDIEKDVPVDEDASLKEGFTYTRTVDEREDPPEDVEDDKLYVVRTTITWAGGKEREEIVRYIRDTAN